jgi:hypothetical protein
LRVNPENTEKKKLTQRRKGAKEREKPEIAAKRHKTHKKEDLKFGKRTFTAAVWIGLKLSGSMTTARLSSYDSVFFELFAPFRGHSVFVLPLRLCGFA